MDLGMAASARASLNLLPSAGENEAVKALPASTERPSWVVEAMGLELPLAEPFVAKRLPLSEADSAESSISFSSTDVSAVATDTAFCATTAGKATDRLVFFALSKSVSSSATLLISRYSVSASVAGAVGKT